MSIPTFWVMSRKLDGPKVNEWELIYDLHLLSLWFNHSWPLLTADSLAEGVIRYFPLEHPEAIDVN